MADARQWIVLRERLIAPPPVGATRYVIKVSPLVGPSRGDAVYKFQNTIPKTIADKINTIRGYLGDELATGLWACGRWQLIADDGVYVTLEQVA